MASDSSTVAVLVRDQLIHTVGTVEAARAAARASVTELHFPGCSIMPGLINTHVHLCGDLSADPFGTAQHGDTATLLDIMQTNAHAALRAGCTTVRDLGDARGLAVGLRDRIAAGELVGPRILAAGSPLTIPGGHCWFLGGAVDGPAAITRRIDELAESGVDLIKVMAGGGQMTPSGPPMWESQFDVDNLALIVERAEYHQLPVAAHAHGTATIRDCVEAGVATIEHCSWRTGPAEIDLCDDTAARMAARQIAAGDTAPPQWRELADKLPFPDGFRLGDQLPWMDDHGVPIVVGTDSGLPNAIFDDFVTPLELLQERGFSVDCILHTATARAADVLGLSAATGRVEAGLAADLMVVDGDPRERLDALRQRRMLLARGQQQDGEPPTWNEPASR